MRSIFLAVSLSALFVAAPAMQSTVSADDKGPLVGGSEFAGKARFETSPTQQYLVARARAESEHRIAMNRYYDSIGFEWGSPRINAGVFFMADPPVRYKRFGYFTGSRTESISFGGY